jgi:YgiT-type zinc finger domain-containing protein
MITYGILILKQNGTEMECVICKNGTTKKGFATVTLEKGGSVIVIKDVPAQICENCGHYYLDEAITVRLLSIADENYRKGVEVEVIHLKTAS